MVGIRPTEEPWYSTQTQFLRSDQTFGLVPQLQRFSFPTVQRVFYGVWLGTYHRVNIWTLTAAKQPYYRMRVLGSDRSRKRLSGTHYAMVVPLWDPCRRCRVGESRGVKPCRSSSRGPFHVGNPVLRSTSLPFGSLRRPGLRTTESLGEGGFLMWGPLSDPSLLPRLPCEPEDRIF